MIYYFHLWKKRTYWNCRCSSWSSGLCSNVKINSALISTTLVIADCRSKLHFENNFSVSRTHEENCTDCWIIESGGVLRSERLFVLAENNRGAKVDFYRASELYITASESCDLKDLEKELPEDNFRILGQNKKTLEYILQVKEFYPGKLKEFLQQLPIQFRSIKQVRLYPWLPPH